METFLCCGFARPHKVFVFFSMAYAVVLVISGGFKGKLDTIMEERCIVLIA